MKSIIRGENLYHYTLDTPIGGLLLVGDEDALHGVYFQDGKRGPHKPDQAWEPAEKPFREVKRQLKAYFDGKLRDFDLPLAPAGTEFQLKVWQALRTIPYGKTWSYGELARKVRRPNASRAVGAANGQNPIPVIVPCHRVIGADGSLTGFGGGLPIKQKLLALEGALPGGRQAGLF
ncbi:MAG TPA: methylated-DNA--[protein]-cysteine S-methyltransferase [Gammaproteobacteria bacterium]|nr:methylated-DNA--[protein]-cysteine S-methyltransferase [Gammaproteobacteria bacterium]